MTDLKEALAGLDAVLPGLPARVTAPHEIAQSLERATQGFLRQLQQFESSAVDRVDGAQQAMADLRQEAAEVEALLDGEVDALESLHQEHSQAFAGRRAELSTQMDEARQAMDSLQQHLGEAGTAATAAQAQIVQVLKNLEGTLEAAQTELEQSVTAALREVELLDVEAKAARAEVEQGVNAFGQLMTTLAENAREHLQQAAGDLDRIHAAHKGALEGHASELEGGREKLLASLQGAIEQELKTRLGSVAAETAEALRALADHARQAARHAASSREDLNTALDGVRDQESSIVEVIGYAKQAVEVVGLVWGI